MNKGWFKKGDDPRRHKLTQEDCSKGFWNAIPKYGVSIGKKLHARGKWNTYKKRK